MLPETNSQQQDRTGKKDLAVVVTPLLPPSPLPPAHIYTNPLGGEHLTKVLSILPSDNPTDFSGIVSASPTSPNSHISPCFRSLINF